jgi:bifunctional non-homologous end joining protein LigD
MLAVPWAGPFVDPGWSFELKWDGVRALLFWEAGSASLIGRRGTVFTPRYPELSRVEFPRPCVLDGEIVALGGNGTPSFERLQRRMHLIDPRATSRAAAEAPVSLVVFDLLHDGRPLVDEPLTERRARLDGLDLPPPLVRSETVVGDGPALWEAVLEHRLEGIVAKRIAAPYQSGARSPDWRKIANVRQVEAVIGGYTVGEGGRSRTFGSLLLGMWDGAHLRWVGAAGTGFSDRDLGEIRAALGRMERDDAPFHPDQDLPRGSTWVEPHLVASIGYRDWTAAGRLRHPRFRGFTATPSGEVTWEREGPEALPG